MGPCDILRGVMLRSGGAPVFILLLPVLLLGACSGPAGFLGIGSRDLAVTDVSFDVTGQQLVAVSFTITATRRGDVEEAPWRVLLSPSPDLAVEAPVVATGIVSLAGGESTEIMVMEEEILQHLQDEELAVPLDEYYVYVELFYTDAGSDADASNNLALNPVGASMFAGDPSLLVPELSVDPFGVGDVQDNGTMPTSVSVTIRNLSPVDVSAVSVDIGLATDPDGEPEFLLFRAVRGVPATSAVTVVADHTALYVYGFEPDPDPGLSSYNPDFVAAGPGSWYVVAEVDSLNDFQEPDEANNRAATSTALALTPADSPPVLPLVLDVANSGFGTIDSADPLEVRILSDASLRAGDGDNYISFSFDSETVPTSRFVGLDEVLDQAFTLPDPSQLLDSNGAYRVVLYHGVGGVDQHTWVWSSDGTPTDSLLAPSFDLLDPDLGIVRFDGDPRSIRFDTPVFPLALDQVDVVVPSDMTATAATVEIPYDSTLFGFANPGPGYWGELFVDDGFAGSGAYDLDVRLALYQASADPAIDPPVFDRGIDGLFSDENGVLMDPYMLAHATTGEAWMGMMQAFSMGETGSAAVRYRIVGPDLDSVATVPGSPGGFGTSTSAYTVSENLRYDLTASAANETEGTVYLTLSDAGIATTEVQLWFEGANPEELEARVYLNTGSGFTEISSQGDPGSWFGMAPGDGSSRGAVVGGDPSSPGTLELGSDPIVQRAIYAPVTFSLPPGNKTVQVRVQRRDGQPIQDGDAFIFAYRE